MSDVKLTETITEDGVVCLLCGKAFRALSRHLIFTHRMDVYAYKERFGYNRRTGLTCYQLKKRKRRQAQESGLARHICHSPVHDNPGLRKGARQPPTVETQEKLRAAARRRREQKAVERLAKFEQIRQWLKEGLLYKEIAARLGVHEDTVGVWAKQMKAMGLIKRTPSRWRKLG